MIDINPATVDFHLGQHLGDIMASPYAKRFQQAAGGFMNRMGGATQGFAPMQGAFGIPGAGNGMMGAVTNGMTNSMGLPPGVGLQLNTILTQAGALDMLAGKAANGSEQAKAMLAKQQEVVTRNIMDLEKVEQLKSRLLEADLKINRMYAGAVG